MKQLANQDPETKSGDLIASNIDQFRTLFPEAFTEGKVDFEVLRQLLGSAVDEREEKYGLNWNGKRRARQIALTPSTGTLRPCPDDSVDWDTTQNLMIEGDNLEVLKLLQKSYAGKVKLIYIDPPYNTGNDFVYRDDYSDSIRNYLALTGQLGEDGRRLVSNPESSGRFHTDWLNMLYPRLKLSRSLLSPDGFLFVSIDENEGPNLRHLLDEIFGAENLAGVIVWRKGSGSSDTDFSYTHDQVVVYRRSESAVLGKVPQGEHQLASYQNPDNDPRGDWTSSDYTSKWTKAERPNLWYPILNPNTAAQCWPPEQRTWAYSQEETKKNVAQDLLWWGRNGANERPRYKRFRTATEGLRVPRSWWDDVGTNQDGSEAFSQLGFEKADFPHPKPVELVREIMRIGAPTGGIVMDFFAGSGTTGHAVLDQAADTELPLRFVLVQFPEPLVKSKFSDSFEVARERVRRVAHRHTREKGYSAGCDRGFRVFKLDSSNLHAWEPNREALPATLEQATEHLKGDRTEEDILFELLLKLGLDLCVPMEARTIAGKTVHSIGGGTLLVCLAPQIAAAEVEPLALGMVAWYKHLAPAGETSVVFRDSAFADDVAKTNLAAILEQHGLKNVRSV